MIAGARGSSAVCGIPVRCGRAKGLASRGLVILAVLLAALAVVGIAQELRESILPALVDLGIVNADGVADGLVVGIEQGKLTAETTIRLLDLLAAAPGTAEQKEDLLLVLVATLESELPAEGLADKAIQGLTRGVSLMQITREIDMRRRLQLSVRELLHANGIFGAPGEARTALNHLPQSSFDGLVTHIAGALGDSLEAGGSPFDGVGLHAAVQHRLTQLAGAVLPSQDVDLVLERIGSDDWTQAVLAALE
ncbi:MAG: hypothetical protein JSW65_01740 [Candidatus Bipolaricaulota bacterium]|nr:MAG: hypothetical protein JSW65_01740 [Candidatus Bipolaricaulota bacterium]